MLDTVWRERIIDVTATDNAKTVFRQVLNWFGPGGVKIRYELLIQSHLLLDLREQHHGSGAEVKKGLKGH
jgi:hypothetical protein